MDFFTDLFSALSTRDSLLVLLFLLIAFLIGLIAGWLYWRSRLEDLRTRLTANQENLARTQADLERLSLEQQRLEAEVSGLRDQLRNCQAEKGQMRAELQALREAAAPDDTQTSAGIATALMGSLPKSKAGEKDDLKRISGVGPAIEKRLNALGIFTYEQVSRFDEHLIEQVNQAIEFFPGRIARDNWVGQAAELMRLRQEDPEAFKKGSAHPKDPEDLKIIEGIGPAIEGLLKNAGIRSWSDLAASNPEELRAILLKAGDAYRIHNPETWPRQAALAAGGDWKAFREYTDFLIAGRDPEA